MCERLTLCSQRNSIDRGGWWARLELTAALLSFPVKSQIVNVCPFNWTCKWKDLYELNCSAILFTISETPDDSLFCVITDSGTSGHTIQLEDIIGIAPSLKPLKLTQDGSIELEAYGSTAFTLHVVRKLKKHKWKDKGYAFECHDVTTCQHWIQKTEDALKAISMFDVQEILHCITNLREAHMSASAILVIVMFRGLKVKHWHFHVVRSTLGWVPMNYDIVKRVCDQVRWILQSSSNPHNPPPPMFGEPTLSHW